VPEGAVAENKKGEATRFLNGSRTVTRPIGALVHLQIVRAYAIAGQVPRHAPPIKISSLCGGLRPGHYHPNAGQGGVRKAPVSVNISLLAVPLFTMMQLVFTSLSTGRGNR
jgi:hypothetical protein